MELERFEEARALTAQLAERGAALGREWALAVAGRCRGLLAAAECDLDAALVTLEDAAVLHKSVPVPFDRARTLLVLGVVRRRARRRKAAREALEQACAELERLGATRWLERGRAELTRLGGRAPSDGELTPSEQKVAALVARDAQTARWQPSSCCPRRRGVTPLARLPQARAALACGARPPPRR